MQLSLLNNRPVFLLLPIIGCSTSPPELPKDYGSIRATHKIDKALFTAEDLNKTCDKIYTENRKLSLQLYNINKDIEDDRTSDQALAYLFGAALTLFGTNSDVEEERKLIQGRVDHLALLRRYKKC